MRNSLIAGVLHYSAAFKTMLAFKSDIDAAHEKSDIATDLTVTDLTVTDLTATDPTATDLPQLIYRD